jgi:hypothetical protein
MNLGRQAGAVCAVVVMALTFIGFVLGKVM